jgi:hypothetical protein
MNADLVWPLAIVGTAAVWVAITVVADWLHRRRQRQRPTWWEQEHRQRQVERERSESEPHIWNH